MAHPKTFARLNFLERFLVVTFRVATGCSRTLRLRGVTAFVRRAYWKSRLKELGDRSLIHSLVTIHSPERVEIGSDCSVAEYVHMWGGGGVTIGNNVLIASHTSIISRSHDPGAELFRSSTASARVILEDNVWVGAGAAILPGVVIGKNAIVGAGAVVTRNVEPGEVVVGIPARPLR